jgi:hypothetical protein
MSLRLSYTRIYQVYCCAPWLRGVQSARCVNAHLARRGRGTPAARRGLRELWGCGHPPEGHRESSKPMDHRRPADVVEKSRATSLHQAGCLGGPEARGWLRGSEPPTSPRQRATPRISLGDWSRFAFAQDFTKVLELRKKGIEGAKSKVAARCSGARYARTKTRDRSHDRCRRGARTARLEAR